MTEPRYIVRAIAKPNQPLENKHLEILVQLGDQTYYLGASVLKLEAKPGEKITMFVELDVNELQIDSTATLIDEQGNRTTQRIKIQGSEPAGHALSSSTLDVEEVEGQEDLYIKDITLTANGHTAGNNLEAHTLRKIED